MNVSVHKNKATSRCSREFYFQRRDVVDRLDFQRGNVETNVTTFPRGIFSML